MPSEARNEDVKFSWPPDIDRFFDPNLQLIYQEGYAPFLYASADITHDSFERPLTDLQRALGLDVSSAFLYRPLFYPQCPKARPINYAILGAYLAQELLAMVVEDRAEADAGEDPLTAGAASISSSVVSRYGRTWSQATRAKFQNVLKCGKDHRYKLSSTPEAMRLNVSSSFDFNDILVDYMNHAGSIKLAFSAYRRSIAASKASPSPAGDREFFMAVTTRYCTNTAIMRRAHGDYRLYLSELLVNGFLQHFRPFADAFSCEAGTPMNKG